MKFGFELRFLCEFQDSILRRESSPQTGWSCSQVKGKLNMAGRQVQRDEIAGSVAVMAIVKYNSICDSWFQRDSQFQPG